MSANKVFFYVIKTSVFENPSFYPIHISFIRFFVFLLRLRFLIVSQGQLQKGEKVL